MANDVNEIKSLIEKLRAKLQTDKNKLNASSDAQQAQEEKEQQNSNVDDKHKEKNKGNNSNVETISKIEKYLDELIFENNRLKEEKLIAVAESQDVVRRMKETEHNVNKFGSQKLATAIIPALDMFRMVVSQPNDIPEVQNYIKGFEMILRQFDTALSDSGIQQIETKVGDEFNPELHQAIEQIETDKVASHHIVNVVANGYKLHDRVIKHVLVKVAK